MTPAQLNAKIYAGRARVAAHLGTTYNICRPLTAAAPLGNVIGSIPAAFNAADGTYSKPNLYGKPIWFADMDGAQVIPGDYLLNPTNPADVWFIAALQPFLPIVVINCSRWVRIMGAPTPVNGGIGVGAMPYSGVAEEVGNEKDLAGLDPINNGGTFVGWPAAINFGPGGVKDSLALPAGSPKLAGYQILLPASLPLTILAGMRIVDDLGTAYTVGGAELSDLGWRLQTTEGHA